MNFQCFDSVGFGSCVSSQAVVSAAMNGMVFGTNPFCGGRLKTVPNVPVFWGAPPNWGGGWASSGIVGTYYSNPNYTGTSFQRTDVRIDVPLTTVLPSGSLATDPIYGAVSATNFSVKWIGSLIPKYTETYIFKVKTGGTLTLKISGVTVATATSLDGWVSASQAFTAGTTYAVEVDYIQGTGPWGAQVHWMGSGAIPFPEEAIGPATPIGVNVGTDDQSYCASGALAAIYQGPSFTGAGPAIDSSGWPVADFCLNQMSPPQLIDTAYSFPNVGYASDAKIGVWTISFSGAAEIYTNQNGLFRIGHNDGSRATVLLNGYTYYNYGSTVPLAAQVYDSVTGTGYNPATNTTTVLFSLTRWDWDNVGFRYTDRNGKGAPGGPTGTAVPGITNLICMRPSSTGATTSLAPGTVMYPPVLQSMAPYVCARDLGVVYNVDYLASFTSPYTDWSKRATPVFNVHPSDTNQYKNSGLTPPWEYRIMGCNMAGKDLYVNLPQTASGNIGDPDLTSSYIYQLANLIKNGSTFNGVNYPGLLPHLCVYIEYANEIWNYTAQCNPEGGWGNIIYDIYCAQQVNNLDWQQYSAMGGWVNFVHGGSSNGGVVGLWAGLKAKNASDIFRLVFGDSVMPGSSSGYNPDPRIRPILESQGGGGFGGDPLQLAGIFKAIKSYFGVAIDHVYWGGGGAWYCVLDTAGADANAIFANITPASVIQSLHNSFLPAGETCTIQTDVDNLAQFNLHCVGYEGGFSLGRGDSGANLAQQQASNDARITPYVQLILDNYFQSGGSLPVIFAATGGPYGFQGTYEVIDGIWDEPPYAPAPPKLQGYFNCETALPAQVVAPTAWGVAPCSFSWIGLTNAAPSVTKTFVASTPGYYFVGFTTNNPYNSATSLVTISVDGTVVGSSQTVHTTGGDSFNVLVWLNTGVHNMTASVGTVTPSGSQVVLGPWGVS